jgi:hypothetical protein
VRVESDEELTRARNTEKVARRVLISCSRPIDTMSESKSKSTSRVLILSYLVLPICNAVSCIVPFTTRDESYIYSS